MPELTIDGRRVAVPNGATLLAAASSLGIVIPTLCFQEGLPHHTSCMLCLVEDAGSGRLVPACATPAVQGQAIQTGGERVRAARLRSLELLLGEHSGDCEAPCVRACPAHADIPAMIRRTAEGDPAGALAQIMERLPLAGTLAYICPAPCQRSCRRRLLDSAVDICALKKAVIDEGIGHGAGQDARSVSLFTPSKAPPTGKRVAVVGAGPAGLATAYFLARGGHRCRVLDEHGEAGGMLRYAVGPERLPPGVLAADLDVLKRLGVELCLGQAATGLEELRAGHDAVVLATGSPERLRALLPGDVRFDQATGAGTIPGLFAGGNATRLRPTRLAVRSVAEGRRLARSVGLWLSGRPVTEERPRFDSRLGNLEAQDLERIAAIAARRANQVKGEAAIAARRANQVKGEAAIAARRADEVKGEAAIAARRADEVKGEAAIAARRADEMKGEAAIAARRADEVKGEAAIAARRAGRREGLAGRAEPEAQGTAGGQPQAEAAGAWPAPPLLDEALRCLSCDCARHESCRLRRLAEELDADGRRFAGEQGNRFERIRGAGGLSFEPGKCIKCGLCVRIAQRGGDRPGLAFTGRGFDLRLRVPFNADIGTALPATASECVVRCPTGALAWER